MQLCAHRWGPSHPSVAHQTRTTGAGASRWLSELLPASEPGRCHRAGRTSPASHERDRRRPRPGRAAPADDDRRAVDDRDGPSRRTTLGGEGVALIDRPPNVTPVRWEEHPHVSTRVHRDLPPRPVVSDVDASAEWYEGCWGSGAEESRAPDPNDGRAARRRCGSGDRLNGHAGRPDGPFDERRVGSTTSASRCPAGRTSTPGRRTSPPRRRALAGRDVDPAPPWVPRPRQHPLEIWWTRPRSPAGGRRAATGVVTILRRWPWSGRAPPASPPPGVYGLSRGSACLVAPRGTADYLPGALAVATATPGRPDRVPVDLGDVESSPRPLRPSGPVVSASTAPTSRRRPSRAPGLALDSVGGRSDGAPGGTVAFWDLDRGLAWWPR